MTAAPKWGGLEVGFDVPALPGMREAEIQTPCLILDLDALEANLRRMAEFAARSGLRLRPHGKMHKSVDIARLQIEIGGAVGLCCQKVSEAEVFVRGGISDVLITNEVRSPVMIDRLARLPKLGAKVAVCVDDPTNVPELAAAVRRHGTSLGCFIEIDCGAGRCGLSDPEAALALARAIASAPGLTFAGVQAYQGRLQHLPTFPEREAAFAASLAITRAAVDRIEAGGLPVPLVTGAGTGSYPLEAASGLYGELQCGSYAFMDADYGRVRGLDGGRLDAEWRNALFLLTSVLSRPAPGRAICDAGLKAQSADSGLPVVFGREGVRYTRWTDEHGELADPDGRLAVGEHLRLVPGHCDPTCNLHDWYVGLRGGRVETIWPVSARGKLY
ncbi:alanine racemase [Kaistia algarum]|uniref:DSD1 family PLP-dependent enzyme n=1 Tax=Kaistia algarum TaxID=2083279 RepID=UPI000CE83675|nr:DSD1 family PLP-dependent enzyme [Kaistia algarum]MCX5512952.1 DSD1 family PLP-dependent enzyme [Kaistia algarum]PPE81560.1 alanine racemase [Kaistia algarum]